MNADFLPGKQFLPSPNTEVQPLHLQASMTSQPERLSLVQNPRPSTLSRPPCLCPSRATVTAGDYQVNGSAVCCLRVVRAETPGPVPAVYSRSHSPLPWQAVELYGELYETFRSHPQTRPDFAESSQRPFTYLGIAWYLDRVVLRQKTRGSCLWQWPAWLKLRGKQPAYPGRGIKEKQSSGRNN